MSEYFTFPCGCKFPVLERNDDRMLVEFKADINTISLDCTRTWDLFCEGNTKGVFQLESPLGRSMSKKLAPRNIEELSALIALMRPGCLESLIEGKSLTQHYIDRKHGREPTTYYHPALEPILKTTYGILTFQEQSMQIAQKIAGFSLQEADVLRKAIGKKKPELMAQVKGDFIAGCLKTGIVNQEQAEEIFGWIEASQRYSFNKSHSISYAVNGYLSAYTKAHFLRPFFTSWLDMAHEKIKPKEEIYELVSNAKRMSIDVLPPYLPNQDAHFELRNKKIYFGLTDIKGIGQNVMTKLQEQIKLIEQELDKKVDQWNWLEFLTRLSQNIPCDAVIGLISTGALSFIDINRTRMLYEYDIFSKLTNKEQKWCKDNIADCSTLKELLVSMLSISPGRGQAIANKNRAELVRGLLISLENPPYTIDTDSPEWVANTERSLLGIPLTCTKIDACDTSAANTECIDFINGKNGIMLIAAQVKEAKPHIIKQGKNKGQEMGFISIEDSSCMLDNVVLFADKWKEFQGLLIPGNTVLIQGERGYKGDGLTVQKVWQI